MAPARRAAALPVAVRLCASCPSKCAKQITAGWVPQPVEMLPDDWMPAASEGRPVPVDPYRPRTRVNPAAQASARALHAARLAEQGCTVREIAQQMRVSVPAARALLNLAGTVRELRAAA